MKEQVPGKRPSRKFTCGPQARKYLARVCLAAPARDGRPSRPGTRGRRRGRSRP
jgi:hypothetical protein